MNRFFSVLVFCLFFLAGCDFDVPLATEHDIPVNPDILGSWVIVPQDASDKDAQVQIFKFSNTEYLVHYKEGELELYFRGYAVNVAGVNSVQLQAIGSEEGPVKPEDNDLFMLAQYRLINGQLEIKTLNTDLISTELSDTESLREAFTAQKNNPELFNDPGLFKRSNS